MDKLKDLYKYLNENNISYYKRKRRGSVCYWHFVYINGKHKNIVENFLKKIPEIEQHAGHKYIQVIEHKLQGVFEKKGSKWETWFQNPYDSREEDFDYGAADDLMSDAESKHWEMDAYEYDGDPDKFDDWKEANGY